MNVRTYTAGEDLRGFCDAPGFPPLDLATVRAVGADLHLVAYDRRGMPGARASLWWTHAPPLEGAVVGCIGHFAAQDAGAAAALLEVACARLVAVGCSLAVGPLDGSTFRAYRFVTQAEFDGTTHPPFFLEPDNPPAWPQAFIAAGFTTLAEYESAITALNGPDPRLAEYQGRAAAQGVTVRSLDAADFDGELARVYAVVMAAFRPNLLFAPISLTEFRAQVTALRPFIHPSLMMLAELHGETVGFLLALPDVHQARRGEPIDTVILKTLAVAPQAASLGVGSLLTAVVHTHAYALGYRTAIHALMHVDNRSRRISAHYARPLRRYTLFARPLV